MSVATAIAIAIVAAMGLAFGLQQALNWGFSQWEVPQDASTQQEEANPSLPPALVRNIAVVLGTLDTTPNAERPAVIAAAQRPAYRIWLVDSAIQNPVNPADPNADVLRHRIEALLPTPRRLIVTDQNVGSTRVIIEAALADGHWVVFECRLRPPLPIYLPTPDLPLWANNAALLALCAGLAILLALLTARSIINPLSELFAAIDQLGGSGETLPIRPRGPREVQTLMRSFNRLQERLRRFNDDRTRMFASMSHDLRTPLTRLRLRTEMLEGLAEQQKMLTELDTTNEMIESILMFARDETQREPRSLVDLSALVEGICQDASDSGAPVTYDGPRGVTISCRPTAIRRAISNLVDNAVKYGKIGLITLSPGPEYVAISVEDEGPGVRWTERERVFEPFYRADNSRNPNTGGVGLGLCVTRSIVWEHGGDITLANRKGGGLSVRLKLLATPSAADQRDAPLPEKKQQIDIQAARC